MDKLRVLSLFSGIGAFEKALTNIGVEYELVNFCEVDKYATKSYCAIHGVDEKLNLGDITKIDLDNLPNNIDLLTHGSPCQDYSLAGKQAGGDKGSGTRSSLMWNSVEIIKRIKPKYIIWENVKGVLSAKNKHNFDQYISDLSDAGYISSWKVLNSCDFGIPQNRERIFCVSILGDSKFEFPKAPNIPCKLKDILENEVPEKYYINKDFKFIDKDEKDSVCRRIANVDLNGHDYLKRVYDTEKCSPTLPTGTCGNHEPKVLVSCAMRGRYDEDGNTQQQIKTRKDLVANCITSVQKDSMVVERNKVVELGYFPYPNSDKKHQSNVFLDKDGLSCTVDTCTGGNRQPKIYDDYRVRKLTPKECWRLQSFSDEDFQKCVDIGMSNTQLYKQAGNSITVRVLEYIFNELFK